MVRQEETQVLLGRSEVLDWIERAANRDTTDSFLSWAYLVLLEKDPSIKIDDTRLISLVWRVYDSFHEIDSDSRAREKASDYARLLREVVDLDLALDLAKMCFDTGLTQKALSARAGSKMSDGHFDDFVHARSWSQATKLHVSALSVKEIDELAKQIARREFLQAATLLKANAGAR